MSTVATSPPPSTSLQLDHLRALEAESIQIMREVVAEFERPVMLYSIGKDSSVMLHLAMKAFYPAKPPFPFLHVDTTWKFKEMTKFRDDMAKKLGIDLLVHINPDGVAQGIGPFTHGSNTHTHVMKTLGLRQALGTARGQAHVLRNHVVAAHRAWQPPASVGLEMEHAARLLHHPVEEPFLLVALEVRASFFRVARAGHCVHLHVKTCNK